MKWDSRGTKIDNGLLSWITKMNKALNTPWIVCAATGSAISLKELRSDSARTPKILLLRPVNFLQAIHLKSMLKTDLLCLPLANLRESRLKTYDHLKTNFGAIQITSTETEWDSLQRRIRHKGSKPQLGCLTQTTVSSQSVSRCFKIQVKCTSSWDMPSRLTRLSPSRRPRAMISLSSLATLTLEVDFSTPPSSSRQAPQSFLLC